MIRSTSGMPLIRPVLAPDGFWVYSNAPLLFPNGQEWKKVLFVARFHRFNTINDSEASQLHLNSS